MFALEKPSASVLIYTPLFLVPTLSPNFQKTVWCLLMLSCYTYFNFLTILTFLFLLLTASLSYLVGDRWKAVIAARQVDTLATSLCPAGVHICLGIECISLNGDPLR